MIEIYKPGNTDYTKNGDVTIEATKAGLDAVLNGSWSYTLTAPIDEAGKWKYIEDDAVIKAPSLKGKQLYRIKKVEVDEKMVTATAQPVAMDAKDDVFLKDVRPSNKTGQEALDIIFEGSKYTGVSDIKAKASSYYYYKNALEAINGQDDTSFRNRWGGEIFFDNYTIYINKKIGDDRGFRLNYGKNIPANGFSEIVDFNDIVTRIYPTAFNGRTLSGTGYVDSPIINNYPYPKAKKIQFEDVKLLADANEGDEDNGIIICADQAELDATLKEKCAEQYDEGLDKPTTTIKADMVMLKNIVGYEEYQDLTEVMLGDTVHCKYEPLDITTDLRIIELHYDSLLDAVTSVKLGESDYQFFNNVASAVNAVNKALTPAGEVIAEQVKGFIDGAQAQLRLQNTIAEKQNVRAILFEDLDPNSPTYGAMALGTQGFEIANTRNATDTEWNWTTFGTAEGFSADLINAGTLQAINIIGVVISGSEIYTTRTYTDDNYNQEMTDTSSLKEGRVVTTTLSTNRDVSLQEVVYDSTAETTGGIWETETSIQDYWNRISGKGQYKGTGFTVEGSVDSNGFDSYDYAGAVNSNGLEVGLDNVWLALSRESYASGKYLTVFDAPRHFMETIEGNGKIADKSLASGTSWVNIGSLTFPQAGIYRCIFNIRFASNATGRRGVCISNSATGGARGILCENIVAPVNGAVTHVILPVTLNISEAGQTIYINGYQNSGSALNVSTRFSIEALRGKSVLLPFVEE